MRSKALSPQKLGLLTRLLRKEGIDAARLAITPLDRAKEATPLSFAQEQLWFLHRLEPESPAYNVHVALPLAGSLSLDTIERSLREIIRRHEILRTVFPAVDGRPAQLVKPEVGLALPVVDLRSLDHGERRARFEALRLDAARAPFDLGTGPLIRAVLVHLSESTQALLLTLHHIVTDGWSMGVLSGELRELTEAFSAGRPPTLPELGVQYADFAAWQRAVLTDSALRPALESWRRQLAGFERLDLPTDQSRPAIASFRGSIEHVVVPREQAEALKTLSRRGGATLFMTLLAVFKVLLRLYSGQTDIVVGSPEANRRRPEVQPLVGLFVNMLPLRTQVDRGLTFLELLARVREVVSRALAGQDVPFDRLVSELAHERDLSRNPVFQVVFNLLDEPTALSGTSTTPTEEVASPTQTTRFDLEAHVLEAAEGLQVSFAYSTDLFERETIRRMLAHYVRLLDAVVTDPECRLEELALVGTAERRELIETRNATAVAYPRRRRWRGCSSGRWRRGPRRWRSRRGRSG